MQCIMQHHVRFDFSRSLLSLCPSTILVRSRKLVDAVERYEFPTSHSYDLRYSFAGRKFGLGNYEFPCKTERIITSVSWGFSATLIE